jgi:hypothetical protein
VLAARARRLCAVGAVAAPVAAIAGMPGAGDPRVVVRDRGGATVARVGLPADGRFALAYRHSYYGAPAEERFVRDGDGFRLEAVASPRAAVLDYYALEGARRHEGRWKSLRPRRPARYRRLSLIATEVGRRTLVAGGRRVPLYAAEPRHLTIAVED